MGAMLVGVLSSFIVIPIVIFFIILFATVIGLLAYKLKMSPLWWMLLSLLVSYWVLIPFAVVAVKIAAQKCHRCGKSTRNNTGACPHCGEMVKRTDDVKIVKKILLVFAVIYAGIYALSFIFSFPLL